MPAGRDAHFGDHAVYNGGDQSTEHSHRLGHILTPTNDIDQSTGKVHIEVSLPDGTHHIETGTDGEGVPYRSPKDYGDEGGGVTWHWDEDNA